MSKEIFFQDKYEASEYRASMVAQGYKMSEVKKTENGYTVAIDSTKGAIKQDINRSKTLSELEKENDELEQKLEFVRQASGSENGMKKLLRSGSTGFGNIVKSIQNPNSEKRIKINRTPNSRSDIPIVYTRKIKNPIAGKNAGITKGKISSIPEK